MHGEPALLIGLASLDQTAVKPTPASPGESLVAVVRALRREFSFLVHDHRFKDSVVVKDGSVEVRFEKAASALVFVAEPFRLPLALVEQSQAAHPGQRVSRHLCDVLESQELLKLRRRDERRCRAYLNELARGHRDAFRTKVVQPFARRGMRELELACSEWARLVRESPQLLKERRAR